MLLTLFLIFIKACEETQAIDNMPTVRRIFLTQGPDYAMKGIATEKEQFVLLCQKIMHHHHEEGLQVVNKKFCNHTYPHYIQGVKFLAGNYLLVKHCLFNKFWWTAMPGYRFFVFGIAEERTKVALDDLYYLCFLSMLSKDEKVPEEYRARLPLGVCYTSEALKQEAIDVAMKFEFLPPHVYHLDLSCIAIDIDRARLIGDYLNGLNAPLSYLNLSGTNIGPEELKKILPRITHQPEAKQEWLLSWGFNKVCYEYNRLWKTFVNWSFCWLKFPAFLDISDNPKLSPYQEEFNCIIQNQNRQRNDLAQIIIAWEKFKPDHRVLNFCAQAIKSTTLDLSGFQFTPQTACQLGEALSEMTEPLSCLNLSGTNMNLHIFKAICPRHISYHKTGELSKPDGIPDMLSAGHQSFLLYIIKDFDSNALLLKPINWAIFPLEIYLENITNLTLKELEKIQQHINRLRSEKNDNNDYDAMEINFISLSNEPPTTLPLHHN